MPNQHFCTAMPTVGALVIVGEEDQRLQTGFKLFLTVLSEPIVSQLCSKNLLESVVILTSLVATGLQRFSNFSGR